MEGTFGWFRCRFSGITVASRSRLHEVIVDDPIRSGRQHPAPLVAIQFIALRGIFNLVVPNSKIKDRADVADSIGDLELHWQR